jgi:hypothetical protein
MTPKMTDVPLVSRGGENGVESALEIEMIDSAELAARLKLPESWVRSHCRQRTPRAERIPCVRFGRYVRFAWNSPPLMAWLARHEQQ